VEITELFDLLKLKVNSSGQLPRDLRRSMDGFIKNVDENSSPHLIESFMEYREMWEAVYVKKLSEGLKEKLNLGIEQYEKECLPIVRKQMNLSESHDLQMNWQHLQLLGYKKNIGKGKLPSLKLMEGMATRLRYFPRQDFDERSVLPHFLDIVAPAIGKYGGSKDGEDEKFSKNLEKLIKNHDLNQRELADEVKRFSLAAISNVNNANLERYFDTIDNLSERLKGLERLALWKWYGAIYEKIEKESKDSKNFNAKKNLILHVMADLEVRERSGQDLSQGFDYEHSIYFFEFHKMLIEKLEKKEFKKLEFNSLVKAGRENTKIGADNDLHLKFFDMITQKDFPIPEKLTEDEKLMVRDYLEKLSKTWPRGEISFKHLLPEMKDEPSFYSRNLARANEVLKRIGAEPILEVEFKDW